MKLSARNNAINRIAQLQALAPQRGVAGNIDFFGEDVFGVDAIRAYLPKEAAARLIETINTGSPVETGIADEVAHGMKQWAIAHGATHFTHWFQPLNGSTAEKHDSFLEKENDRAIFAFSAKNLIMGEPDASSFPSGGIRHTFEARGYTAWDPTSPAFIKRHANGATLCIPTVFYAYTGEALDKKTPLLRSTQCLSAATKRLMKCFGLPEAKVTATLGPEQEYFLIDKHFYYNRPDLLQTGRTLFGAAPAKHQQLEDHYFGSIKQRVLNFMNDVEDELWRLGVPAKTRHNEVAPAQFELAPIFEDINLAVDHNMLVMETLRQTADRHGLVCLLHEKPFAGINGSGKHNNWAISYGDKNLLNPGKDPHQNAIFLAVLCCIIEAIDTYADMLRMTVTGAGNDHRLGANEAPPAIISIYLGDQLNAIIEQVEQGVTLSCKNENFMQIGVDLLPSLPKDATDRNRTSPFAFTGNKFEFRAPGSSQSCAGPMTVLNTIVAEAFNNMADKLEKLSATDFNANLQDILQATVKAHKRVIFNGDGYADDWKAEAARRGLPNATSTMAALQTLKDKKNIDLFEKYGVYSRKELESRYEIFMEEYHRRVRIEGSIGLEIARTIVKPSAIEYFTLLCHSYKSATDSEAEHGLQSLKRDIDAVGTLLDDLEVTGAKMEKALEGLHEEIISALDDLRLAVDALETMLPDEMWALPKYREMLFIY